MQTEETRALIDTYYETLPTGDRKKLASLFTEDIVWHPPQSAPIGVIEGPEAVAAELGGDTPKKMFDMKTFRLTIHRILADGDTAVVQHAISAKSKEGEQYDNEYCWYISVATAKSPRSKSTRIRSRPPGFLSGCEWGSARSHVSPFSSH